MTSELKCDGVPARVSVGRATLGATLDELWRIIEARRTSGAADSYTARLLTGELDQLLKKIGEEAAEVVMAAKDESHGGSNAALRYEAVDLLYHLCVTCVRAGVSAGELAAEIKGRFK
jgi:phosphoribosyl-ATP pyrophosphohydrolase